MADRDRLIDELARAILDGTPIDWRAMETSARGDEQRVVGDLRLLSLIADLHRRSCAASAEEDEPAHWGHLRLLERIGGGAFGDVYRAWDTRLERQVALKLIPVRSDAPHPDQILREGRLLARVHHPGVVAIYDAQQLDDRVGLVMEFIRGRTLEQRLDQQGVFGPEETTAIGIELCGALSTVHAAGLLHRDIKAHNVVMADDGRIVLMDFGTGRKVDEASAADVAGTPLYLAPEIFQGREATVRSDVYSLGVLLFHILTGTYPVRASSLSELREAHEREAPSGVQAIRADVPDGLARVIDRAIDPRPERRYADASTLSEALVLLRPVPEVTTTARRRRWLERLGVGAAAAVLVVVPVERGGGPTATRGLETPASLLVGSIIGGTGDGELAAMMQEVVRAELERSPLFSVFPSDRVRESLARMDRPATATIDDRVGTEICKREGLTAMVSGTVTKGGGLHFIQLRALHAGTGRVLKSVQDGRSDAVSALEAVSAMTRRLREELGESLASIQATSPPLEPVTTSSFEAVRHFTLGKRLYEEERAEEALSHFLEAIRLDPDFVMAHEYAAQSYAYLGDRRAQRAYLERAAALASDSSSVLGPLERAKVLADYNTFLERYGEAARQYREMLMLRPYDDRAHANLGLIYGSNRQYPQAIQELEAAWRTYPHPRVRWMLAGMYSANGHPDKAVELLGQHLDQPYDWIAYAGHLLVAGRRDGAETALQEAERRSHQDSRASWADLALALADFYRSEGRYSAAEAALQQGLDRGGNTEMERLQLAMASLLLDWGRRREAIVHLRRVQVGLARNRIVHGVLAARAGDLRTAEAVLERLVQEADERRAPRADARVHQLRAEIALGRGRGAEAHAHAARAVRAFSTSWTLETLARTQHAAGKVTEAIETWTTILHRPGERAMDWDAPAYAQFVLAHYQLARLLEESDHADEARARYEEFLRFWARADPALAPLLDARARRLATGQGAQSTPAGRVPNPAA